jgi:hypothetical protein
VNAHLVRRERRLQADEPPPRRSHRGRDLSVLVGDAREIVEPRDRVVQRFRAEHDGERVDVSLLVQVTEMLREETLGDDERLVRRGDLLRELALRDLKPERLALERRQLRLGGSEPRVEGVEVEESLVRAAVQRLRLLDGAGAPRRWRPSPSRRQRRRAPQRRRRAAPRIVSFGRSRSADRSTAEEKNRDFVRTELCAFPALS